MKLELTDYSTKRNSEQSPLLRLPAELRNQIYRYTLSGYAIRPYPYRYYSGNPKKLVKFTYCEPAPGRWIGFPEDNLWLLVQRLSCSSRQLHAEIGEMLFTESIVCLQGGGDRWYEWLGYLSEKRKAAIEKIRTWVPPDTDTSDTGDDIDRIFEGLDPLPNVKTLYVVEGAGKLTSWVEEKIAREAQRRGLEVFFERNISRLDE